MRTPVTRATRATRRKRLGHERPGTVLHGPPIAVRCPCGERRDLAHGESWRCEHCGLRWSTEQIPREQYDLIRRTQLRFRALPVGLGLVVSLAALLFAVTGNAFSAFVLVPMGLIVWMSYLRPIHRRRYRRAISHLPSWVLRPQPDGD